MRRLILASTLLLAACATQPQQQSSTPPPTLPLPSSPPVRHLVGLTANDLVRQLGNPALQIREGSSVKLQFRGSYCVLDAYLYPQSGVLRVTYIDTRLVSGADTAQAACISELENPS
jgi:hypothetical protein